ncbi:protein containing Oligopeptide/dipeptide ABC transporter, partial [mine drainage metagenome]
SAIPIPDPDLKRERIILQGDVPSPAAPPSGCHFHTRCPAVMPICSTTEPPLIRVRERHWVACHLYPDPLTTPESPAREAPPVTSYLPNPAVEPAPTAG